MLLLALPAAAGVFGAIGEEVLLLTDRSANWPRAFPDGDGWHLLAAAGGEYHYTRLGADLVGEPGLWVDLTGHDDLVDHGIAACPDGTWLHVASATSTSADDSAYAFRYDADFTLVAEGTLARDEVGVIHRDQPVTCGPTAQGAGFFAQADHAPFRWVGVDASAAAGGTADLGDAPMSTGASVAEHDGTLWIVGFPPQDGVELMIRGHDPTSFAEVASLEVPLTDDSLTSYWSQGLARVGDTWIVAYMARDEAAGWQSQDGDVWLAAFDEDWTLLEQLQVTTATPPIGNMQPWVAHHDGRLLVTYTRDLSSYGVYVDLAVEGGEDTATDTSAEPSDTSDSAGEDTATDTAPPGDSAQADTDTGAPADDGGPKAPPPAEPCGCRGGAAALFVPGLFVARRRRS